MAELPAYFSSLIKKEQAAVAAHLMDSRKNQIVATDSVSLDWALRGGIARNELTLLWGVPAGGKTTLALKMLAKEQKAFPKKLAVWIDTEYSFDANRAKQLGVDIDRLILFQSNSFSKAIAPLAKISDENIKDKSVCFIGLDSVKGLQSVNEENQMAEGETSSAANAFGGIAKSVNPALKILLRLAAEAECMVMLTNHANMNMDPQTAKYYPYILSGGQQLKHLCSTIIFMDKPEGKKHKLYDAHIKSINDADVAIGSLIRAKVTKSRRTVEGKVAEFFWNLETGEFANKTEELIDLAKALGVIYTEGTGLTLYYGQKESQAKLGLRHAAIKIIEADEKIYRRIWDACQDINYNPALNINTEIVDPMKGVE